MVSPELLRRNAFFALLNDEQIKMIAQIAEEVSMPANSILLKEDTPAIKLFLILEGDADLIYSGGGEGAITNALVGSVAAGEMLGVSSLIEPYRYISSARVNVVSRIVVIDGAALRDQMNADASLGFRLMSNVAAAVLERLKYTQVELAAARA